MERLEKENCLQNFSFPQNKEDVLQCKIICIAIEKPYIRRLYIVEDHSHD